MLDFSGPFEIFSTVLRVCLKTSGHVWTGQIGDCDNRYDERPGFDNGWSKKGPGIWLPGMFRAQGYCQ